MNAARHIEQQAAEWLMRREEPDWSPDNQNALDSWLERSLAHKAAYWRLVHGWQQADRIASLGLEAATEPPSARSKVSWLPVAAAASIAGALLVGNLELSRRVPIAAAMPVHFSTPVGGRRTIPLLDGSKVELNTATVVRTAVSDNRREIWLDQGEAYFEVAHLNGRPFIVHAANRTVTVLGTKFSVRREGDKVTVAVIEGRVRIDDAAKPDDVPTAIITAGDVAIADAAARSGRERSADRRLAAQRRDAELAPGCEGLAVGARVLPVEDPQVAFTHCLDYLQTKLGPTFPLAR